ncbi:MAG: hypothetical protein GDA36_02510 [Rhodobacteraceae bacterium]|nr:hypothetical protein [Paracoccaceae bacterium]
MQEIVDKARYANGIRIGVGVFCLRRSCEIAHDAVQGDNVADSMTVIDQSGRRAVHDHVLIQDFTTGLSRTLPQVKSTPVT